MPPPERGCVEDQPQQLARPERCRKAKAANPGIWFQPDFYAIFYGCSFVLISVN
jgi:hypothetical protein